MGSPQNRLSALANQLRQYRPPAGSLGEDDDEEESSGGKVVSQVGFTESAAGATVVERFKPRGPQCWFACLKGEGGDLRVILTKRSSKMSTHSVYGKCRFNGAVGGAGRSLKQRQGKPRREIGLDPSLVNVVAFLEPFLSKHLLRVIPVIGILADKKPFKPRPNPAEVDDVFDAPLEMDENRRAEDIEWLGDKYLIHYFDYMVGNNKYLIWGLTAGILIRAASVVYQRPPAFREQNPNFKDKDKVLRRYLLKSRGRI
ncbi:hypothetical protein MLD38_010069 [Melastoma candidum]|uniref:Uncharacterized protein n=1 Tax=Melastoma candidum TaxID=119954 RepID=A0ACB9QYL8_9MYRT|nr:hypothetical protein MLD38_010069 [Melastoma candidum]